MTRTPGDSPWKRKAILRDWADGYTEAGSARMRGCTLEFVREVRDQERKRRLYEHLDRQRRARSRRQGGINKTLSDLVNRQENR